MTERGAGDMDDRGTVVTPSAEFPPLNADELCALRRIGDQWQAAPPGRPAEVDTLPVDPTLGRYRRRPAPSRFGRLAPIAMFRVGDPDELVATEPANVPGSRLGPGVDPAPADPVRAAVEQRGGALRADAQGGRPAGALLGPAQLGGVRAGGDADRPGARREQCARAVPAAVPGARGAHGGRRRLVPADDPRLPARGRLLHRGQRQPRRRAGARGRGRPDAGLRADRGGVGGGRGARGHLGAAGAHPADRAARRAGDRCCCSPATCVVYAPRATSSSCPRTRSSWRSSRCWWSATSRRPAGASRRCRRRRCRRPRGSACCWCCGRSPPGRCR